MRHLLTTLVVTALAVTTLLAAGASPSRAATAWTPRPAAMTTPWTDRVPVDHPLPEYPRPQLTRPDWANLNGIWDFAVTSRDAAQPTTFGERIRVPFAPESALSGIQRKITGNDRLWYRRTFTVPAGWSGRRVQLNFGASDWETTVRVNGRQAGVVHRGGYDAFSYDITPLLNGGTNTVVVSVFDPTETGGQAIGKQRIQDVTPHAGHSIVYTASSGIWQTVWLEPTAAAHITRLDMVPHPEDDTLHVTVRGTGTDGAGVEVGVSSGGTTVGSAVGTVGTEFAVPVPNARLWSPEDPFLYDVSARLTGSPGGDRVGSYTGMRSIAVKDVDGVRRPVLNGRFVFQTGTLDQGFWPDGNYTAPTDDALKYDLQKHKDLGFNMVRKHIKVEPQRWFYWADRLGLLVWQDMPSMDSGKSPDSAARTQWESEYRAIIDQHRSSPALIQWVDQNEGWGQYDQARIADMVKAYDPARLVDNMSGVNCCGARDGGNGDVVDNHNYVGPGNTPTEQMRASVLGEYGGLGYRVPGHEWYPGGGFSYEDQPSLSALNDRLVGLLDGIRQNAMPAGGLSASVYTQITDVENEANGLMTYDRQVVKVDESRVRAANQALVAASRTLGPPVRLPLEQYVSIRVTTPGYTDRYIRHHDGLGYTEVVGAGSGDLLKRDATWKVRPGLANRLCYSFESRNYPGEYLRHREFRVRREAGDDSALYKADATWCPVQGNGGIRLSAAGFPGQYLRHINAELWLAQAGGTHSWDNPAGFTEDTTWAVEAPWAP
ncbi:AbfB domain-containing protein [Streptomyces sp. 5-8]|uniref:AbfB domain-containing protein n=1 Tax=Streptomyces musisoli TaxID=2802280 RepID=A0ABS1NW02_9ACTN|nr:AbfB domain-containing protein [Streptomyces musisoli]MBY8844449.1 AbfB domain-containing protein [Streptomyces sp. SP2-10]